MMCHLNKRALERLNSLESRSAELKISFITEPDVSRLVDFGVEQRGGLQAGLELARICLGDLAQVNLSPSPAGMFGSGESAGFPLVQVFTDQPLVACMGCQYGGWPINTDEFSAIASGPMRAARGKEPVLVKYGLLEREKNILGVLECSRLPEMDIIHQVADECEVESYDVTLCVAPTRSITGAVQIVARSVEATIHKLFELEFDLRAVTSGYGTAPLPPVSADDLTAIGRTNDAILYGGRVTLWLDVEDEQIVDIGPRVPSNHSAEFGRNFQEIFEASGGDFYQLDPMLFSAAEVTLISVRSGRAFCFGELRTDLIRQSFCNLVNK